MGCRWNQLGEAIFVAAWCLGWHNSSFRKILRTVSGEMEEVSIFVLLGLKSRLKTSWYIVIARSPANPIPYQNKGMENDILARKTSQCQHSTSAKWSTRHSEEAVRQKELKWLKCTCKFVCLKRTRQREALLCNQNRHPFFISFIFGGIVNRPQDINCQI